MGWSGAKSFDRHASAIADHGAIAIGAVIIRAKARGNFFNLVDLVNQLKQAKAAGSNYRLAETLLRHYLIGIDELALP